MALTSATCEPKTVNASAMARALFFAVVQNMKAASSSARMRQIELINLEVQSRVKRNATAGNMTLGINKDDSNTFFPFNTNRMKSISISPNFSIVFIRSFVLWNPSTPIIRIRNLRLSSANARGTAINKSKYLPIMRTGIERIVPSRIRA